ncbi:MAG: pantoate--beta-alanine ligase [Saprospiraceae bacterium]
MYLFKSVHQLNHFLKSFYSANQSIGFVPTMGALHQGHLSLMEASLAANDLSICSIFVNPTQFNESSDLEKYPRVPGLDIALLAEIGCDVLFMPPVTEIYPPGIQLASPIPPPSLINVMEGQFRPGHFEGVVQVVKRLLDITQPTRLYMGQKDYQQATIVQWMIENQKLPVELVVCPIEREKDGLAMSSRNVRLQAELRPIAATLYKTLEAVKIRLKADNIESLQHFAINQFRQAGLRPEYFEIINGYTLQPLSIIDTTDLVVACTAVWVGDVRLIDNMILQDPG